MKRWTFGGPKGVLTTVDAPTEAEARRAAMVERWGPEPDYWLLWLGITHYTGKGLWIKDVKDVHDNQL